MSLLRIKTNCIERPLRKMFRLYAKVVTRFPFVFIITTLLTSTIFIGGGVILFRFEYASDSDLFTSGDSRTRQSQMKFLSLFPTDYDEYRPSRVYDPDDQEYLSAILYSNDGGNILRRSHIQEVVQFNADVMSVEVRFNGSDYFFEKLCAKWASECFRDPLIDYLSPVSQHRGSQEEVVKIPYPNLFDKSNNTYDVCQYLGGIRSSEGFVNYSDYILLRYLVRKDEELSRDVKHLWEMSVREYISEQTYQSIRVLFLTSSDNREFRDLVHDVGLEYLIIFAAMIVVAVATSLMLKDHVQGKPWLVAMGAASVSMAALSGVGVLSFCGFTFNQVTIWMPLFVLAIGLHQVFILVSSWRCNNFSNDVEETMREAMEYAGVTITMATLIEILIYTVSTTGPYPVIRDVGLYVGVSLVFSALYQFTLFCPALVIAGRREAANRHGCIFLKVRPRENPRNTACYDIACAGGREDHHTVINHLGKVMFEKYFATVCHFLLVIVVAFIIYLLYLGGAVYGVVITEIGHDTQEGKVSVVNGVPKATGSMNRHRDYDPSISLVIAEEIPYWNDVIEGELLSIIQILQSTVFIKDKKYTQCWFIDYYKFLNNSLSALTSEVNFMETLRESFLNLPEYTRYRTDIIFDGDDNIRASRCILFLESDQITNEYGMLDQLLDQLHDIASDASNQFDTEVILFGNQFLHYEQYTTIFSQIRYLIVTAVLSTLFIALLLVPNPVSAIAVTAFLLSSMAGVIGYGTFWGVTLNPMTLVVTLLCVGLCVEFTAHMTYTFHFVNMTPISRLSWSLGTVGYPSLQMSLCVLAGAGVVLAFPGHIYRACARLVTLNVLIGYSHTIFFIPTILMVLYRRDSEMMYTI